MRHWSHRPDRLPARKRRERPLDDVRDHHPKSTGPRGVPDDAVIFIYREQPMGRWANATLVTLDGEEITGLARVDALDALQRKLDAPLALVRDDGRAA